MSDCGVEGRVPLLGGTLSQCATLKGWLEDLPTRAERPANR